MIELMLLLFRVEVCKLSYDGYQLRNVNEAQTRQGISNGQIHRYFPYLADIHRYMVVDTKWDKGVLTCT